jgi:uncharacterized membrane-anchored protein
MKKGSLIALVLLIAVHLAIPFHMIRDRENTLRNGELFMFRTRPIDPADPFQGRYVRLAFEEDYLACPEDEMPDLAYREPIYILLKHGENGFAKLVDWSRERPSAGHYLKSRCLGKQTRWNSETKEREHLGIQVDLPFNRFYMDEAKAPRAEILARDAVRSTNCWANVRILNGKAVIEDVFAAGQSLRELAAQESR